MITLGPITFDDNLLLDGADMQKRIAMSARWSLRGGVIINSAPVTSGQLMTLVADERGGFFTRQQIQDVRNLQALGLPVPFLYNDQYDLNVVIVDPINFEELKKYNYHYPDDIGLGVVSIRGV